LYQRNADALVLRDLGIEFTDALQQCFPFKSFLRVQHKPSKPVTAGVPVSSNDDPSQSIAAFEAVPVDSVDRDVAAWLTQDNSEVALTARASRFR
jgi:hypothetical protein